MTTWYLLAVIAVVMYVFSSLAYAQSNDISLSMQKDMYYPNDVVAINGTTSSNQLVTAEIKNPFDKTVLGKSLLPTEKGQFSISYIVDSYPTKGTYVVLVTQNSKTTASYFGVYSKPSIRLESSMDMINYRNTDQPHITIFDLPESVVDVKIFDNSQVEKFEDKIKTSPEGHAIYALNITSYPVGVYSVLVTSSTGQQKIGFSVGLPPTGGHMTIDTDKNTYLPGNNISILGAGNANSLVTVSLIDPDGTFVTSVQTFSNNTGHFSTHSLKIPQDGIPGTWRIDAASGVNHETIEIKVILSESTIVQNGTNATVPIYGGGPVVAIQLMPSPLKQFKSGIAIKDVKCNDGLQFIMKNENSQPACVKPQTMSKLIERGWGIIPLAGLPTTPYNSTYNQPSSALKLSLVTNSKTIHFGDSIWMEISVRNTLSTPFMASEKNDWKFDASSLVQCSSSPVGISILDGYYTEENMTKGKQLLLYDNTMTCPYVLERTAGYQFEPMSSKIIDSCNSTNVDNSCSVKEMRYQVSFKGYWQGNLYPFDIGTHTIVGADEWGHVAIEHFTVTNPASIYLTQDNSGKIGINKNGTVSGTKMIGININNFHQSRYPLIIQSFYTNGTLYRIDKIPSTSISPDGSFKYNFTISSSNQNAVYGSHRIIVTYNTQTAETMVGVPIPP
jgi:hypothetical protein